MAVYKPLLADAEFGKDRTQNIIRGYFASDHSDVMKNFTEILCQKISRNARF